MKNKNNFNEEAFPKVPEKDKEFVPNKETIDAMIEGEQIATNEITTKSYKTFDDMWSDICGN